MPTDEDLSAIGRAQTALAERWDDWLAADLIPMEQFPKDTNDQRPNTYGMDRWHKLFAPRQLLAMLTYLETLRELAPEMERDLGKDRAAAVRTYLAIVLDKCANFNAILASWDASRDKVRSVFDRHDLAMKWSFAEMNMALKDRGAFPWALEQIVDSYKGLCGLVEPSRPLFNGLAQERPSPSGAGHSRERCPPNPLPDESVDASSSTLPMATTSCTPSSQTSSTSG